MRLKNFTLSYLLEKVLSIKTTLQGTSFVNSLSSFNWFLRRLVNNVPKNVSSLNELQIAVRAIQHLSPAQLIPYTGQGAGD